MTFKSLFRQLNIFSVLLIIAGMAFALRVVNIVTFGSSHAASEIGAIMPAAAKDQVSAVKEEPPPLAPPSIEKDEIEKAVRETALTVDGAPPAGQAPEIAPALPPNYSQTRAFSASEIDVLQSLSQRRDTLDKREKALAEREALLDAAGQEVDHKIAELNKLRNELESLLGKQQQEQSERISSLVKIYEGMKPKEAATIFDTLDMEVLLSVISRMNERKSSPILASMNPEKARLVTIRLAEQKQLPPLPETTSHAEKTAAPALLPPP